MNRAAVVVLMACALGRLNAQQVTAGEIIDRIKKQVGVPWRTETVDTIKAGDPATVVTGVATTFAATFDVLKRASAAGKNLIVAHEPTFYNHLDKTADLEDDPVLKEKLAFIAAHHMVVFRFHDHWHARRPDGILEGMTGVLGWGKLRTTGNPSVFVLPETNLTQLARGIAGRLSIRTMRVVGEPGMKVTKVALMPGAAGSIAQIRMLERPDVEVLVAGESREWETVEYVRDAMDEGRRKALILLGHVPSEEMGMDECARWLRTFVKEVPVEFVPAKEPFWRP